MAVKIQIRRDTAANWTSANPTLSSGEAGFETDTGKVKYGDGSTAWNSLSYTFLTASQASSFGLTLLDDADAATARSTLGLGALSTLSAVNAATITDNSVGAAELNVSGNGTAGYALTSDGDGTFSWSEMSSGGGSLSYLVDSEGGTATAAGTASIALGSGADVASLGTNSIAIGKTSCAASSNSLSIGAFSDTIGSNAVSAGYGAQTCTSGVAVGYSASAGVSGVAIGISSNSSGNFGSLAIGCAAKDCGTNRSTIIGGGAHADLVTSNGATAIGTAATAGNNSVAVGCATAATGTCSVAIGEGADATAVAAVALGADAQAVHTNGIALGREATTTTTNQMVIGSTAAPVNDAFFASSSYSPASDYSIATKKYVDDNAGGGGGGFSVEDTTNRTYALVSSTFGCADATPTDSIGFGENIACTATDVTRAIIIGNHASSLGVGAQDVIAIGYCAALCNRGYAGVFIGTGAGKGLCAQLAYNNTAVGHKALSGNATMSCASGTVAIGAHALTNLCSNNSNGNTAVGQCAGACLCQNPANTLIGYEAGKQMSGAAGSSEGNVVIGYQAMSATTSNPRQGVVIGYLAGNNASFSGFGNVLIGRSAGNTLTTGQCNIVIGTTAEPASATATKTVTLGKSDITQIRSGVTTITSISDCRDKCAIEDVSVGLNFVNAMRPVTFEWNSRDGDKVGYCDIGFIAQELDIVQCQFNMEDKTRLTNMTDADVLEATPMNTYPIMVKAIQELSAKVDNLQSEINELKNA